MDCQELRDLAKQLSDGAAADIWYDAESFADEGNDTALAQINETQEAMTQAARFLTRLAEVLE
jgi:hypothetical protein